MTTQLIEQAREAKRLRDLADQLPALEAEAAERAAAEQRAKQQAVDEAKRQFTDSRINFDTLVERRDQLYGNAIQAIAAALDAADEANRAGQNVLTWFHYGISLTAGVMVLWSCVLTLRGFHFAAHPFDSRMNVDVKPVPSNLVNIQQNAWIAGLAGLSNEQFQHSIIEQINANIAYIVDLGRRDYSIDGRGSGHSLNRAGIGRPGVSWGEIER